jgi:hypothetical protein
LKLSGLEIARLVRVRVTHLETLPTVRVLDLYSGSHQVSLAVDIPLQAQELGEKQGIRFAKIDVLECLKLTPKPYMVQQLSVES